MTRPYSLDLRKRVVAAVACGQTCRSVAATFWVSVSCVVKWSQRHRATGSATAGKVGGHRRHLLEPERDWLLGRLAEDGNLTLHKVRAELAGRAISVSCETLWRFLRREGISFKKTVHASEQDRPDVARGPAPGTVEEVPGQD